MFYHLHLSTTPHLNLSSLNFSHISQPFSQPLIFIFISHLSTFLTSLNLSHSPPPHPTSSSLISLRFEKNVHLRARLPVKCF
ncbi:hypothetical protein NC651_014908 [Populus alba x Populus x berolinensis]|nr:hypothetical protein NC651_014908 [Populus alba x Populus x berolinensis]